MRTLQIHEGRLREVLYYAHISDDIISELALVFTGSAGTLELPQRSRRNHGRSTAAPVLFEQTNLPQ